MSQLHSGKTSAALPRYGLHRQTGSLLSGGTKLTTFDMGSSFSDRFGCVVDGVSGIEVSVLD